jgi:hypothetical protein
MELSGLLHARAVLHPRKEPLVLMDRRLEKSQSLSGICGERIYLFPLPTIEIRFLGRPGCSKSLYSLSYTVIIRVGGDSF